MGTSIKEYIIKITAEIGDAKSKLDQLAKSAEKIDKINLNLNIEKAFNQEIAHVTGALGKLKQTLNNMEKDAGKTKIDSSINEMASSFKEAADSIKTAVEELNTTFNGLKKNMAGLSENDLFRKPFSDLTEQIKDMMRAYKDAMNMVNNIMSGAVDMGAFTSSGAKGGISSSIASAMTQMTDDLSKAVKVANKDVDKITRDLGEIGERIAAGLDNFTENRDKVYTAMFNAEDNSFSIADKFRAQLSALQTDIKDYNDLYKELDETTRKNLKLPTVQDMFRNANVDTKSFRDFSGAVNDYIDTQFNNIEEIADARDRKAASSSETRTKKKIVIPLDVVINPGQYDTEAINSMVEEIQSKIQEKVQRKLAENPIKIPIAFSSAINQEGLSDEEIDKHFKGSAEKGLGEIIRSLKLQLDVETASLTEKINGAIDELNGSGAINKIKVDIEPRDISQKAINNHAALVEDQIRRNNVSTDGVIPVSGGTTQIAGGTTSVSGGEVTVNGSPVYVNGGPVFVGGEAISGAVGSIAKDIGQIAGQMVNGESGDQKKGDSSAVEKGIKPTRFYNPIERMQSSPALESYTKLRQSTRASLAAAQLEQKGIESLISLIKKPGSTIADLEKSDIFTDTYLYDGKEYAKYGSTREPIDQFRRNLISLFNEGKKQIAQAVGNINTQFSESALSEPAPYRGDPRYWEFKSVAERTQASYEILKDKIEQAEAILAKGDMPQDEQEKLREDIKDKKSQLPEFERQATAAKKAFKNYIEENPLVGQWKNVVAEAFTEQRNKATKDKAAAKKYLEKHNLTDRLTEGSNPIDVVNTYFNEQEDTLRSAEEITPEYKKIIKKQYEDAVKKATNSIVKDVQINLNEDIEAIDAQLESLKKERGSKQDYLRGLKRLESTYKSMGQSMHDLYNGMIEREEANIGEVIKGIDGQISDLQSQRRQIKTTLNQDRLGAGQTNQTLGQKALRIKNRIKTLAGTLNTLGVDTDTITGEIQLDDDKIGGTTKDVRKEIDAKVAKLVEERNKKIDIQRERQDQSYRFLDYAKRGTPLTDRERAELESLEARKDQLSNREKARYERLSKREIPLSEDEQKEFEELKGVLEDRIALAEYEEKNSELIAKAKTSLGTIHAKIAKGQKLTRQDKLFLSDEDAEKITDPQELIDIAERIINPEDIVVTARSMDELRSFASEEIGKAKNVIKGLRQETDAKIAGAIIKSSSKYVNDGVFGANSRKTGRETDYSLVVDDKNTYEQLKEDLKKYDEILSEYEPLIRAKDGSEGGLDFDALTRTQKKHYLDTRGLRKQAIMRIQAYETLNGIDSSLGETELKNVSFAGLNLDRAGADIYKSLYERKANIDSMSSEELRTFLADLQTVQAQLSTQQGEVLTEDQMKTRAVEMVQADIEYEKQRLQELDQMFPILDAMIDKYEQGIALAKKNGIKTSDLYKEQKKVKAMKADAIKEYRIREQTINDLETNRENYAVVWQDGKKVFKQPSQIEETLRDLDGSDADIAEQIQGMVGLSAEETDNFVSLLRDYEVSRDFEVQALKNLNNARRHESDARKNLKELENQNQRAEAVLQNALNKDQESIDKADEVHQQYISAKAEVDIAEQSTKNAQQIYSKAQRDTKKAFGKITAKYGKQRQAINEMIGNVSYALPQELMDKYQITGDIMENIGEQFAKIQDYDDYDSVEAAQARIDVRRNIQKLLPEASESDITDILNNIIVNRDPSEQVAGLITQLNQNRLSREQLLNFQDRIKKKNINTNGALQKRVDVYVKQQKDAQKQLNNAVSAVESTIGEVNTRLPIQERTEATQRSEAEEATRQAEELARTRQEGLDLFKKLVSSTEERDKYFNEYYDKRIAEENKKIVIAQNSLQKAKDNLEKVKSIEKSKGEEYIKKSEEYSDVNSYDVRNVESPRTLNEMIDAIPNSDPNKNRYLVAQNDLTKQQKIIDNTKNPDAKKKAREGLFPIQKKLNTAKNALIADIARGLEQEIDGLISELQDAVNKDDKGATVRIANVLKTKLAEINKEEFIRSRIPGTDTARGLYIPSQKIAGKSVGDYVDYAVNDLIEKIHIDEKAAETDYLASMDATKKAELAVKEAESELQDTIKSVEHQKEMHDNFRADALTRRNSNKSGKTPEEIHMETVAEKMGIKLDEGITTKQFNELARITGVEGIIKDAVEEKIEEIKEAQESPKKSATSEQKPKSKLNSGVQEKTESDKNAEADMIRTGITPVKSSIVEKETEQIKDNTKATKENTKAKKGQKKAAEEAAKATVTESKSTSKTKSSDQISDFRARYARAATQDDRDAIVKEALASGYYVGKSETNEGKYSLLKNKKDGAISSYEDYLKERPVITSKPAKKEKTTEESKEMPKKETGKKAKPTTTEDTKATIREQIKDAIANAISQDEVDSAIKQAFEQGFGVNKNDKNKSYYITKEPGEKSLKDYEQYLTERQELDDNYFMKNLRKQGNAKLFAATSPEEYNEILKEYVGKGLKLLKNEDSGRITLTAGTGANEELTQELLTNGSIKIDLDFSAKKSGAKQAAEDVGDVKKQADEATTAVIDLKNALADMQSILSSSGEKGLTDSLKALKLDELKDILKNPDNKLGSTKVSGLRKPELINAIVDGVKNSVAETPQNKRDQVINELLARKQAGEELSAVEESILEIAGSMKETKAIIDEAKSAEDSKPKTDSKKTSKQTAKQLRAKYYNATSQEDMDNVIKQAFESGYGVTPKENGLYSISNKPTSKQVKDYETYLAERADNTETMALKNLATEGNRKYHNAKTDQEKAEILKDYVSKGLRLMEQEVPEVNKNGKPNKNAGQKKYVLSATGNISGTDITDSFAKDNNITIKMTTEPKPTTTTPSQIPEPSSVNSALESVATSGEQAATSEERVATAGDAAADALGKVAGAASGAQGQGQTTGDQSPISSGKTERFYRGVSSYDDDFLGGGHLTHEGHTYGSSDKEMILEAGYAGIMGKLYEFEVDMSNRILEVDAGGQLSTEFEYLGNNIDADSQKLNGLISNMKQLSNVSLTDIESLYAINNLSDADFQQYFSRKLEGTLKPEGLFDIKPHLEELYGELLFAKQAGRNIDFVDQNIFKSRGIDISSLIPKLNSGVEELYQIIMQIISINQDQSKLLGYSIKGLDIPGASFTNDDFAKKASGMGYDAVIFRNIMDSLELDYNNAVTDVISIFNDKIIKAVRETKLDEEGELIPSSTRSLTQKEWTKKSNQTPVLANTTTQQPETPNETPLPVIKLGEASESTTDSLETLGKATDDTTDELNQNAVVYKKSPVEWLDYIDASKDMAEAQHRMVEAIEDNIHFSYSDKYRDFYMTRGISKNADHVDITEQLKTNKTMREQFLSAYDNDKSGEFIDSLKGKNGVQGAADNASASLDGVTGSLNNVGEAADGLKKKTEENAKKPEVSKLAEMPKPTEESKPAEKSVEKPVEKSSETPKEVSTLQPIRNTKKPTIKSKTSAEIEKMLQDVYERGAITEDDIDVIAGTLGFYKGDLRKYLKGHSGTRKSDQIDYLLGQSNAYQTLRGQESGGVLAPRNDSATRKKNEEAIKGEAAATAELEQSQKGVSSLAPQDTSETHRKNAEAIKEENNALKENNELKSQGGGTTKSSKKETQTRPDSKKDMDIKGLSNADLKKEAEEAAKEAAKGTSRNGPWFKYLNELWQEATTSSRGNFGGEIEDITLKAQQAWSDVRKVATQKAKAEIGFKNAYEDVAKYFGNTQDMYTFAESRAANMAKDNFKIKSPISNEDLETYRKMDEAIGNMESAWKKLGETGATITPEMEQMHNSFMEFYDNLNKYTDERYGEKISGSFKSFYDSLSWQEQVGNSFGLEKLGNTLSDLDKQFQNGAIDAKGLESGIKGAYEWYDKYAQINKAFGKNGMGTRIGEVSNAESAREFAKSYIQQRGYKQLTDLKGSVDMGNGEAINTFTAKVINAKGEVEQLKFAYSEFSNEVRVGGTVLEDAQSGFQRLFNSITGKAKQLATYWTAQLFNPYMLIRKFKEVINTVKELDTALTEMRKVSDESYSTLKDFASGESFDIAKESGSTAKQIMQSTADFMRIGESFEEAKKSAKTANVLLNVSEFQDINAATEALTAMSQAYKELEKTEITDKLNYIGNNYSISTSELAQSLQKSAGTLKVAGNTFDEAVALTVAGNQVLQDPLTVGQSLKTISMRLNGTSVADMQEAGEEIDGLITTKSKLQKTIKDLTKVKSNGYQGVDILDANGNYKTTYENLLAISEVFKEIGEEDKKFGTNRQNGLLETIAGKTRAAAASSILSNPDVLRDVLSDSMYNSYGSAEHELDAYLDSVQGKITQFQNSTQELTSNIIDNDFLKDIISMGTGAVNVINTLADSFGGLNVVIGAIGGILMQKNGLGLLFNKDASGKLGGFGTGLIPKIKSQIGEWKSAKAFIASEKSSVNNLVQNLGEDKNIFELDAMGLNAGVTRIASLQNTGFTKGFAAYVDQLDPAIAKTKTLAQLSQDYFATLGKQTGILSKIGGVFSSFVSTMGSMALVMAASYTLGKVLQGAEYLIHYKDHKIEEGKEAKERIDQINKEQSARKDFVDNNLDRYFELRKGVSGTTNRSLPTEDYAEFIDLNNQLANQFPQLVSGYDTQGNALLNLSDNINTASTSIKNLLDQEQLLADFNISKNLQDLVTGAMFELEDLQDDFDSLSNAQEIIESITKKKPDLSNIGFDENGVLDFFIPENMEGGDEIATRILNAYREAATSAQVSVESMVYDNINQDGEIGIRYVLTPVADDQRLTEFKDSMSNFVDSIQAEYSDDLAELTMDNALQMNYDKTEMKATWNKLVPSMLSAMNLYDDYRKLGDSTPGQQIQKIISDDIANIDLEQLFNDEKSLEQFKTTPRKFLREKFLDPIMDAISDEDGNIEEPLLDKLNNMISFDDSQLTIGEYNTKVQEMVQDLVGDDIEAQQDLLVLLNIKYKENGFIGDSKTKEALELSELTGIKYQDIADNMKIGDIEYVLSLPSEDFDFQFLKNNNISPVEQLQNWISQNQNKNTVQAGSSALSDILNDETFQTDTSKTESHISALSSALDNFRESGELTTEQLHDLQKEVPELSELGDSLTMEDVGDKLWENIGDYATKFHEAMDRMDLSDEGKTQAQNYLNSFFDQFADIPVREKNAQKALHDFFVNTEATSAETAAQRGVEENRYKKAIDALHEKYGDDIDWSVVMSILADPSLAEAETQEFIDTVDTQEATVKIRADIEQAKADLDKFVENAEADISAQEAYIARKQAKGSTGEFGYDFREASVNGTDLSNTVFGNIDVADRQVIKWTPEALHKNRDILKQWEYSPKPGTSSTIMGDYRTYDGLGVAFSPMLQTDHGAEILSPDTIDKYIGSLLSEVQRSHPDSWNTEDLLTLDSRGLVVDGKKIKNIIADVGETAEETSRIMHEIGAPFTETGEFRVTKADYEPIIQRRRDIANETASHYQYLLDEYDNAKDQGATKPYLHDLSKQIADAQADMENRQADLYNAERDAREADLNWYNTMLENHQAIGEDLESERTILENNGKVVTHELAQEIAGNRRSQIQAQQTVLNENNRLYENTGEVQYLQNMVAARNAIEDIKSLGTTADQVIWESQVTNLGNSLQSLEATATTIQDAITLQEGQGLKPTIDQYRRLVENGKQQVKNLEDQNYYLSRQQNRLTANSARWREIGAQINSNNSAIAAMNGNINNWQDNLRNFAGDMGQSLLSALQAAFDESNSATGLQFGTMKELAAQFEGIEGFDFADIFYNTAQGVKLDADATERLVDAQYQLATDDLTKRINNQNTALQNLRKQYANATDDAQKLSLSQQMDAGNANLNNLYNQLAQYQALYSQAQRQIFSGYGEWQRALSSENAGAMYDAVQGGFEAFNKAGEAGEVGTDDFKTYLAMFDEWGRNTYAAYEDNKEKMKRYITDDYKGFVNLYDDLVKAGFGTKEGSNYNLDITDTSRAAHALGISEEFLGYGLQKAEDYGLYNDFVQNRVDGELKLQETAHDTAEAFKHRNELIAEGASKEAIQEANDEIDRLTQRRQNLTGNIDDVVAREGKISAREIEAGAKTIRDIREAMQHATTDGEKAEYQRMLQNVADEYGFGLDENNRIILPEEYKGYRHHLKDAKDVEDVTTAQIEGVKLEGESIENNETLQSGLGKLKNGWKANTDQVQKFVDTLKGANIDDLMALDLNDGNVVKGLEAEEAALDGLVSTFGLTADEAKLLVPILQELGVLGNETLYNKPGVHGALGVDVGAAQNYLDVNGFDATALDFDAASMSADELMVKMREISGMALRVDTSTEGGQEALDQLNELYAACQKEYDVKVKAEGALEELGMTAEQFLALDEATQKEYLANVGIDVDSSEYDSAIATIEGQAIQAKIETALTNNSELTLEQLYAMEDEEFITTVGCDASQVDDAKAKIEEMMANEYDFKVAINDASIAEIGKSIVAALNGQEYKKDVTLEAKGQDKVQAEAEKPATKKVTIVEVVQKARDFVSGVAGAVSNFFGGRSTQTVSASLDTNAATTALNALKAEASNIPVTLDIDGAVGQIDSLKSSLDEISGGDPIHIEAENEVALSKIDEVVDKANGAEPKIKIDGENGQAKSSVDQVVAFADRSVGRIKISADRAQATSAIMAAVSYANGRTAKIKIGGDAQDAITAANDAVARIRRMIANISINANVRATVTGTVVRPTKPTPSRPSGHTNTHINDATHYNAPSYSGTLSSIGRGYAKGTFDEEGKVAKSGSAYNMLNYKDMSGYAKGDIAIDKDQKSLINELGTESIIYRM